MWRRSRYLAGKLAVVRAGDWRFVAEGQLALIWARVLVWVRPEGELIAARPAGAVPREAQSLARPTPDREALARRLALGVSRAAAYGVFRPLCLVRAVALNALLDRHEIRGSEVRVGVKWADGKFAAHAWVEYGGTVLGDDERHVRAFSELDDLRMAGRRQ